jgi:hypothetical protein
MSRVFDWSDLKVIPIHADLAEFGFVFDELEQFPVELEESRQIGTIVHLGKGVFAEWSGPGTTLNCLYWFRSYDAALAWLGGVNHQAVAESLDPGKQDFEIPPVEWFGPTELTYVSVEDFLRSMERWGMPTYGGFVRTGVWGYNIMERDRQWYFESQGEKPKRVKARNSRLVGAAWFRTGPDFCL